MTKACKPFGRMTVKNDSTSVPHGMIQMTKACKPFGRMTVKNDSTSVPHGMIQMTKACKPFGRMTVKNDSTSVPHGTRSSAKKYIALDISMTNTRHFGSVLVDDPLSLSDGGRFLKQ